MRNLLTRLSFPNKLRAVILITAGTAMLIAITVQGISEMLLARKQMTQEVSVLSTIVGRNAQTAVLFQDKAEATALLESLHADNRITFSGLYLPDGSLLASFAGDADDSGTPASAASDSGWLAEAMRSGRMVHQLDGSRLDVMSPIYLNREIVGWLHSALNPGQPVPHQHGLCAAWSRGTRHSGFYRPAARQFPATYDLAPIAQPERRDAPGL